MASDYLAESMPALAFALETMWVDFLDAHQIDEVHPDCRWTSRIRRNDPSKEMFLEFQFEGGTGADRVRWTGQVPYRLVAGPDHRLAMACFAFNAGRFLKAWKGDSVDLPARSAILSEAEEARRN